MAWSADRKGSESYTIHVRDIASGRDLDDEIRAASGEIVWAGDSATFYYVELDESHRPARVRRHRVGTQQSADARPREFELLKEIVESMRRVRSEYAIAPGKNIEANLIASPATRTILESESALLARLAPTTLNFVDAPAAGAAASAILGGGTELNVPLEGLIDVEKECAKLTTELAALEKQLTALEGRLSNEGFISRAPANVVEAERLKRADWTTRRDLLRARVGALCGAR